MTAGVIDNILEKRTGQTDSVVRQIAERVLGYDQPQYVIGLDESDGVPFFLAVLAKFTYLNTTQYLGNGREGTRPGD